MSGLEDLLMKQTVPVPCPCGANVSASLSQLQSSDHVDCPACGSRIELKKDGFTRQMDDARKSAANFDKTLKRLFKKK